MSEDEERFRDRLAALRVEYLRQLPARIAQLEEAWAAAKRGEPGAFRQVSQYAHGLTGSGATFGLSELSRASGDVERAVKRLTFADESPDPRLMAGIDELLKVVRESIPSVSDP